MKISKYIPCKTNKATKTEAGESTSIALTIVSNAERDRYRVPTYGYLVP